MASPIQRTTTERPNTMNPNSIKQHELKAEWIEDKHGPAVMLTQADDGYDDPQTILVHPWQFRAVCEQFGILPTGDAEARRSIARTTRRLLALNERIQDLRHYVATHSDHEHADLLVEMTMLNALGDLADEWAQDAQELAAASATAEEAQEGAKSGAQVETTERAGIATAKAGKSAKAAAQPALL